MLKLFQKYCSIFAFYLVLTLVGLFYFWVGGKQLFGIKVTNVIANVLDSQQGEPAPDSEDTDSLDENIFDDSFDIDTLTFSKYFIEIPYKVNFNFSTSFWYCIAKPVLKQPPKI